MGHHWMATVVTYGGNPLDFCMNCGVPSLSPIQDKPCPPWGNIPEIPDSSKKQQYVNCQHGVFRKGGCQKCLNNSEFNYTGPLPASSGPCPPEEDVPPQINIINLGLLYKIQTCVQNYVLYGNTNAIRNGMDLLEELIERVKTAKP